MGLDLHSLTTVAILAMIFLNLFILISSNDLKKYKRLHSIFLWPATYTILGFVIFTGVIMMAAKHLDFSLENIAMILLSLIFITLEVKRVKSLKYLSDTKDHAFNAYKPIARTILQVEFLMVLIISIWMWLV
jgi:SNF family Na+-dependent transporter